MNEQRRVLSNYRDRGSQRHSQRHTAASSSYHHHLHHHPDHCYHRLLTANTANHCNKLYSHFIPDRKRLVVMLGGAIINLMAELFLKYLHAFNQIICEHWRNI